MVLVEAPLRTAEDAGQVSQRVSADGIHMRLEMLAQHVASNSFFVVMTGLVQKPPWKRENMTNEQWRWAEETAGAAAGAATAAGAAAAPPRRQRLSCRGGLPSASLLRRFLWLRAEDLLSVVATYVVTPAEKFALVQRFPVLGNALFWDSWQPPASSKQCPPLK